MWKWAGVVHGAEEGAAGGWKRKSAVEDSPKVDEKKGCARGGTQLG